MAFPWQEGKFVKRTGDWTGPGFPDKEIYVLMPARYDPKEARRYLDSGRSEPVYHFSNYEAAVEYRTKLFGYRSGELAADRVGPFVKMVFDNVAQILRLEDT